jgi:hypothetical protein
VLRWMRTGGFSDGGGDFPFVMEWLSRHHQSLDYVFEEMWRDLLLLAHKRLNRMMSGFLNWSGSFMKPGTSWDRSAI